MNCIERILYYLQGEMIEPKAFGIFHIICLLLMFIIIYILYSIKGKHNDKQLKFILGFYSIVALILEVLKQLIWSFNYDSITNSVTWDYEWYAFPFQLCTTPIYVCLFCLFLKKGKLRDSLLSYISFITILGSISTMILPDSCLVSDILVNIHTMWLHLGSFVISVYLLITKEVKLNIKNLVSANIVFIIFVLLSLVLNISIYSSGILNGETFNMFYISPYFISDLPVFNIIQENLPYLLFLIIYIWTIVLGSVLIFFIVSLIKRCGIVNKNEKGKEEIIKDY
ncbi:MAG: YwaF family protein [Bacilli bacterium]|nr:YwaF family protein [Bacilli bacterium]